MLSEVAQAAGDGLDLIKSIPNIASAGAVIASVVLFLKAQRDNAREQREQIVVIVEMLGERLEGMAKQVEQHTLSERDLHNRMSEQIDAMSELTQAVSRLSGGPR